MSLPDEAPSNLTDRERITRALDYIAEKAATLSLGAELDFIGLGVEPLGDRAEEVSKLTADDDRATAARVLLDLCNILRAS